MADLEYFRENLKYRPSGGADRPFYVPLSVWNNGFKEYFRALRSKYPQFGDTPTDSFDEMPVGVVFGSGDRDLNDRAAAFLKVEPSVAPEVDTVAPPETEEFGRTRVQPDQALGLSRRGRPAKYPFNNMRLVGDTFLVKRGKLVNVRGSGNQFLRLSNLMGEWTFKYFEHPEGVLVMLFTTSENRAFNEVDGSDGSGD